MSSGQGLAPNPLEMAPLAPRPEQPRRLLHASIRDAMRYRPLELDATSGVLIDELRRRARANPRFAAWPEQVIGPLLGYLPGTGPLFYRQEAHRLVLGGSGNGKGTAVITPLLLHDDGHAAVLVDPKSGKITKETLAYRRSLGPTYVFDPYNKTGLFPDGPSDRFNPLSALDPFGEHLVEDAAELASAICYDPKSTAGGDTRYWDEQSRSFVTGLLVHLVTYPGERADFLRLREIAVMPMKRFETEIGDKMLGNPAADGTVIRYAEEFARNLQHNAKNFESVFSNVRSYIRWTEFQQVRRVTSDSTFNFSEVRREGGTVYIVLPDKRIEQAAPWLRVVLQAARLGLQDETSTRPVHFIIDETAALGRFEMITAGLRAWREDNIRLHLFFQNLDQIKRAFGEGYEAITDAEVIQFLGSNNLETLRYISELIGERDVIVPTETVNSGWSRSDGISSTEGTSATDTAGTSSNTSTSVTKTLGANWSFAEGASETRGTSESETASRSVSETAGTSESVTKGTSSTSSRGSSSGSVHGPGGGSWNSGSNSSYSTGSSSSQTQGTSQSRTEGETESATQGSSVSQGATRTRTEGGSEGESEGTTQGSGESTSTAHGRSSSKGRSSNTGESGGDSRSVTVQLRRIMRPEQLRQLPSDQMVVLVGNREAVILEREHYYKNPCLVERLFDHQPPAAPLNDPAPWFEPAPRITLPPPLPPEPDSEAPPMPPVPPVPDADPPAIAPDKEQLSVGSKPISGFGGFLALSAAGLVALAKAGKTPPKG